MGWGRGAFPTHLVGGKSTSPQFTQGFCQHSAPSSSCLGFWAPLAFPTQASPVHYPSGEEPYQDGLCIFLRILVAQEGWGMGLGPLPIHTITHGRFCPSRES